MSAKNSALIVIDIQNDIDKELTNHRNYDKIYSVN
jgi:nicotinamidase-related amidase